MKLRDRVLIPISIASLLVLLVSLAFSSDVDTGRHMDRTQRATVPVVQWAQRPVTVIMYMTAW